MTVTNNNAVYLLRRAEVYSDSVVAVGIFCNDPFVSNKISESVVDVVALLALRVCPTDHSVGGVVDIALHFLADTYTVSVEHAQYPVAARVVNIGGFVTGGVYLFRYQTVLVVPVEGGLRLVRAMPGVDTIQRRLYQAVHLVVLEVAAVVVSVNRLYNVAARVVDIPGHVAVLVRHRLYPPQRVIGESRRITKGVD